MADAKLLYWITLFNILKEISVVHTDTTTATTTTTSPATTVLPAPGCTWSTSTDGRGDNEIAIGYETEKDCPIKCAALAPTNNRINGATRRKSDGKCWCEIGMKTQVSDKTYDSCFFRDITTATTTAAPTTTLQPATPFSEVGCFKDTSSRAISGGNVNFPPNTVIQKCFERAKEAGNEYFGVQYNEECYTSKDAGSTYNKYGKGTGCKNGRGGGWLMTVYRINQAPKCRWSTSTDGRGDDETAIGYETEEDCASKCAARAATDNRINGATRRKSDGKCWCEIGMKTQVSDQTYDSCFFEDSKTPPTPTTTSTSTRKAAPPCQVEVFQHGWHDGIKDTYTQSTPQVRRNDDLSSLKVSSGCCAILYEDAKYKGASKKVCKDMQIDEFGHDWNDKVSSIKIEKQGPKCSWLTSTDGHGNDEIMIGYETETDCASKCAARAATDNRINGATRRKSDGKCWCEIGMKTQVSDQTYDSCFFEGLLRCRGEDDGCCTEANPCNEGGGDCDNDDQCAGSLVCGRDNCPKQSSFDGTDDCCMKPVPVDTITYYDTIDASEFSSSCGGDETENIIEFPTNGSNYKENLNCKWTIKRNHNFALKFHRFDVEDVFKCGFDYVRVGERGTKLCGRNIPDNDDFEYLKGEEAILFFHSDAIFNGKGFKVEIVKTRACWEHKSPGCVGASNIKRHEGTSLAECQELCVNTPGCVGFEYGVEHGGARKHYKPGDCQLNTSKDTKGCDGFHNNLDFYALKKC